MRIKGLYLSKEEALMRKSYVILTLLVAAAALALTGCELLFQNQFKAAGLGQPDPAQLAEQVNSDDPVVAQTAQVTLIEQKLQETGASQIVASINVAKLADVGDDKNQIVNAIIPTTLQGPEKQEDLAKAINSLAELKTDIDNLAQSIKEDPSNVTEAAKDQLQTALLVTVIAALEPANPAETVGDAVAKFVNAGSEAKPEDYFKAPDLDTLKNNDTIATLLDANGYGTLEDFFNSFK